MIRNHIHRINTVAQRLTHLTSLRIPYQTVNQYILKRTVFHAVACLESHTGNPEENDIIAGHKHVIREVTVQIIRLLRPAQRGERPQCTGEPGIQNILILNPVFQILRILHPYIDFTGFLMIPGRNAVSPPQLTGDTPILDIFQPLMEGLFKALRIEVNFLFFDFLIF